MIDLTAELGSLGDLNGDGKVSLDEGIFTVEELMDDEDLFSKKRRPRGKKPFPDSPDGQP